MVRVRTVGVTATVLLVLAACGSPAASPTGSGQASPTASPTIAPTPAPTAQPTSTPSPSAPLEPGWNQLTEAPVPFLHDVTTDGSGFLGVGMASDSTDASPVPAVWRSADGMAWEEESYELPTAVDGVVEALYHVEEFGDGFAALGSAWYGIAVSTDGVSWTYESLGEGACPAAIAANDEVLVAVGSIGPCGMGGGPGTPAIWVRDAERWTLLDAPVSAGQFNGVVATPYGFTAWGTVTESVDAWTCEIGCSPDLMLEPFANAPWSSADGWTWSRAGDASPFVGATVDSVGATGDTIVALGSLIPTEGPGPVVVWISGDGDAWSMVEDAPPFAEANEVYGVRIGGGGALLAVWAVNADEAVMSATMWTSADGERWDGETTVMADLRGISGLGNGLIAYGTVPRSDDGGQEPCNKDEVIAGTCRNVAAAWVYAAP